jgi:predicted DNA-binding transcriptional regulator YafY
MEKENIKLKIIDSLLADGINITGPEDLKEHINRNLPKGERPIKKDQANKLLSELRELVKNRGVAIYPPKNTVGYKYSEPGFRFFEDIVGENEKNLLLVANSLFNIFSGSGLSSEFSFVVNKILKKRSRSGEVKDIENFNPISLGPAQKDPGAVWLPILIKAMRENECLDIVYYKAYEGETKRVLSPYILKQYSNTWYLVAYDHHTNQKDKTKVFKLSRIKKIETSGTKFKIDPEFSANDYFKYTIGILHSHLEKPIKIEIQVLSNHLFESWKESPLHSSQTIKNEIDNIVEIETYKTHELFALLLRHGPSIKVISPASLRDELKEKIKKTLSHYN